MVNIVPVILAGGKGSRLYPLSVESKPKQFLKLVEGSNLTMLQLSAMRALAVSDAKNIITVTMYDYKEEAFFQLSEIDKKLTENIILEPRACNTAAAISVAAIYALKRFSNPILWVMPSDHVISGEANLYDAVKDSVNFANLGKIITFGIKPTDKNSNYGYIIGGDTIEDNADFYDVSKFIEKPKGEKLEWVFGQEKFWFNSGMFVFSAKTLLDEVKDKSPNTFEASSLSCENANRCDFGFAISSEHYKLSNGISIDNLVMENSNNLIVNPVDMDWVDIGSWDSLLQLSKQKGAGQCLANFLRESENAA